MKRFIAGAALAALVACGARGEGELVRLAPDCNVVVVARDLPQRAVQDLTRNGGYVAISWSADGYKLETWDVTFHEDDERWGDIISYDAGCSR